MLESLIEPIVTWTVRTIETLGYVGVFLTMAIESASIPLPSEIIMPFSGFLVAQGKFNLYLVVLVGAAGNLFGSILMYFLGYYGQEAVVKKLVRGPGRILISEEELNFGESWFRRYGDITIFVSRILPVARTFISLPAGMSKLPFLKFCILTFTGSLIWSTFLTLIGVKLGENWNSLESVFRKFDILIVVVAIIVLAGYFYHKYRKFFYAKENAHR